MVWYWNFAPLAAIACRDTRAYVYDAERRLRAKKPHALVAILAVATIAVSCDATVADRRLGAKHVAHGGRFACKCRGVDILRVCKVDLRSAQAQLAALAEKETKTQAEHCKHERTQASSVRMRLALCSSLASLSA
eukprot:4499312-Pleurochrysis_carterae.AAC.7